ncbi:MAG TPA: ROK family protein [Amaricoccus sp.]|nr:ROK family protein [Amaricoccus sp.]
MTDLVTGLAIGVDLGGTQLRAALVAPDGRIEARQAVATRAGDGPEAVLDQIAEAVATVARAAPGQRIRGVGVSAPGPLDTGRGVALRLPTLAGFTDFPLAEALARRLGLPVRLENDGIAACLAEWRLGAGQGRQNLVYVTLSTGIGGGVIADGRVLRGRMGLAGHVGHMTIVKDGALCPCGNRGCWEAYAAGPAFAARASARAGHPLDAAAVFAAADAGDPLAQELVAEEADLVGVGLANLLHLYSPEIIVLGGGLASRFEALRPGIAARLAASAMPAFRDVPLAPAALGGNAGLVGAGLLVLDPA